MTKTTSPPPSPPPTAERRSDVKLAESAVDFAVFVESAQYRTLLADLAAGKLTEGDFFFIFTVGREAGLVAAS